MKLLRLALLAACIAGTVAAQASTRIEVLGTVPSPGTKEIATGLRLGELLQQLQIDPRGYWLGASWQRESLKQQQKRLKAGILFDLTQVRQLALLQDTSSLASTAQRLSQYVSALPVTGRKIYDLDPLRVELNAAHSPKLEGGDRLIVPIRPEYVRVVGGVIANCQLRFAPLKPAHRYVSECAALPETDPDYAYLIQPDGKVTQLGVALWNRQDRDAPPAPGSVLLVPLDSNQLKNSAPDLNREFAEFLATQSLPAESP
jgi:hypothetical protein